MHIYIPNTFIHIYIDTYMSNSVTMDEITYCGMKVLTVEPTVDGYCKYEQRNVCC